MSKAPKKWTPEEDRILLHQISLAASQGKAKDWTAIAEALPERSNKDCRKRWCNHLIGGLRKGSWEPSEDQRLAIGVKEHGQQWPLVAEEVGTRSADQCAKRWHHSLNPDLDHSKWTQEEERTLLHAVEKHGRAWKEIKTNYFPGRATNNVKNRYVTLTRRRGSRAGSDTIQTSQRAGDGESSDDESENSSDEPGDTIAVQLPQAEANSSVAPHDIMNTTATTPFDIDMFATTDAPSVQPFGAIDVPMTSGDAFMSMTAMDFDIPMDIPGLDDSSDLTTTSSSAMHNGDLPDPSSVFQFDPERDPQGLRLDMTFDPQPSHQFVLSIENPSMETVTGVMGVLVHSKTKFRIEMK
ncbi:SANT domain DNA binding protein [Lasiodiplodia theobromae]|nr:SANT domain DNA binding protein [Lasiodiplodia theobromae]